MKPDIADVVKALPGKEARTPRLAAKADVSELPDGRKVADLSRGALAEALRGLKIPGVSAGNTMEANVALYAETIKQAVTVGRDPASIQRAVTPLVDSAKKLAPFAGRDPSSLDAQVATMLFGPSAAEAGGAKGVAEGAAKLTERKTLNAAGFADDNGGFKDKKDRVSAESSLRDDYTKASASFMTIRDAKNRIDNLDKSGAGDMALIFQFMKILDPGSTVREGEYATAKNAAGIPETLRATINHWLGEGSLSEESRRQFKSQAEKIYQAQAAQHDKTTTQFANIAKRQGLNPDNVIIDQKPGEKSLGGVTSGGLKWRAVGVPSPPDGFKIVP